MVSLIVRMTVVTPATAVAVVAVVAVVATMRRRGRPKVLRTRRIRSEPQRSGWDADIVS